MKRISNTSWFIDGNKVIKLCDKTVLNDTSTALPMDRIKDFFFKGDVKPGDTIPFSIKFMDKICDISLKKYKVVSQPNPSVHLYWKGSEIDKYLNNLEDISIYDFKEEKDDKENIEINDYTRMEFIKNNDGDIELKIISKIDLNNKLKFIFKMDINYSFLNRGFVIPQQEHEKFLACIPGGYINPSQSYDVKLIFDDDVFEAKFSNANRDVKSDTLRILFRKDLCEYLKQKLAYSERLVKQYGKEETGETAEFYLTGNEKEFYVRLNTHKDEKLMKDEKEIYIDTRNVVETIKHYIQDQGYNYTQNQLSNLYLSLKTKPFVILAGISGTGKSKIVRLLAESLGATADNGQFNIISVRPDWSDNTELVGYKNLNDQFIEGYLTKIIKKAINNKNKPYFVCLDEMNLARVEYYLSDYLSIIESRKNNGQEITTDSLIEDTQNLYIPENLYLIGTVNMDDTTFTFSRKVLDRANTIEFSDVDLENLFNDNEQEIVEPLNITNAFLKTTYLKTIDIEVEYREYAKQVNKKIIAINEILKKSQKQFAYRVRDEILFYMIENKKSELLDEDLAFDYQIMQKILPTISGSEGSIKDVLINLFNYICDADVISDIDIEEAVNYLENETVQYKNSAEKIIYMLRGYDNDGYASYWY